MGSRGQRFKVGWLSGINTASKSVRSLFFVKFPFSFRLLFIFLAKDSFEDGYELGRTTYDQTAAPTVFEDLLYEEILTLRRGTRSFPTIILYLLFFFNFTT